MEFNFVEYDKSYIIEASKMMGKTWDFDKYLKNLKDKDIVYSTLFELSYVDSNYRDMAIAKNGNLMGFLMAGDTLGKINFSKVKLICSTVVNFLGGRFGERKSAYNFAKESMRDLSTLMASQKEYDNEVKLFFVDEASRGTGLGKILMNRYIEHCRVNNINSVILMTDEGCNYGFYDHYGYKRINKIHSNIFSK